MIGLGLMIRTLVTVVEGVGSCTVVMAMTMNCDCCSVLVGYLLNNKCKCKRYGSGKSDSQSLAERLQMLSSRKREISIRISYFAHSATCCIKFRVCSEHEEWLMSTYWVSEYRERLLKTTHTPDESSSRPTNRSRFQCFNRCSHS